MPQRKEQNPIRMGKTSKNEGGKFISNAAERSARAAGTVECPACKADVPPKPGFRMRSLKCPKCGAAMHK